MTSDQLEQVRSWRRHTEALDAEALLCQGRTARRRRRVAGGVAVAALVLASGVVVTATRPDPPPDSVLAVDGLPESVTVDGVTLTRGLDLPVSRPRAGDADATLLQVDVDYRDAADGREDCRSRAIAHVERQTATAVTVRVVAYEAPARLSGAARCVDAGGPSTGTAGGQTVELDLDRPLGDRVVNAAWPPGCGASVPQPLCARSFFGLPATHAALDQLAADPAALQQSPVGFPISQEEDRELSRRDPVRQRVATLDGELSDLWPDRYAGLVVTPDVRSVIVVRLKGGATGADRELLRARVPSALSVRVERARYSAVELHEFHVAVLRYLTTHHVKTWVSEGIDDRSNSVLVGHTTETSTQDLTALQSISDAVDLVTAEPARG